MADRSLVFPASEFRARTARMQSAMAEAGQDAVLLTMPADIFYLTGFLTRFWESPARPWFLVLPATGTPIAVIPAIGEALMDQTWIEDIRSWPAPDPEDDGVSLLAETLREVVRDTGAIGLPMGLETHVRMPLADIRRVEQDVKPRRIVDATGVVQRTREIKSETEIGKLREICAIAGNAFEALPEIAVPGTPIANIFRAFQAELLHRGADWVSYLAGASGHGGYPDVIAPATDRPLAVGDVLMLDTGAVKDGYFCDFDRNVFVGPQPAEVYRTQEALWRATEDTLAGLRPGMRAADAHRMLSDGIERYGARACPGRLGHGLGITLTEWPSFTARDRTELREGMVLTLEPSAFVDGTRFLVHEENIVLRADGPELLSPRAPRAGHQVVP